MSARFPILRTFSPCAYGNPRSSLSSEGLLCRENSSVTGDAVRTPLLPPERPNRPQQAKPLAFVRRKMQKAFRELVVLRASGKKIGKPWERREWRQRSKSPPGEPLARPDRGPGEQRGLGDVPSKCARNDRPPDAASIDSPQFDALDAHAGTGGKAEHKVARRRPVSQALAHPPLQ